MDFACQAISTWIWQRSRQLILKRTGGWGMVLGTLLERRTADPATRGVTGTADELASLVIVGDETFNKFICRTGAICDGDWAWGRPVTFDFGSFTEMDSRLF